MAEPFSVPSPWVIAHRGYSGEYPENTMLAFRKAIEAGADWIELDVTLSLDRQIVVIHDDTLDRTTDLSGPVRDFTFDLIRTADAGSWKGRHFAKEPVPDLWSVWESVLKSDLGLNIEIKSSAYESEPKGKSIEHSLVDFANSKSAFSRTLFSSFCWDSLARIRELSFEARLGVLIGGETPAWEEALELAFRLNAFSLNLSSSIASREVVEKIQSEGFKVFVYTLNSIEELKTGILNGVDGIFTNYPPSMRSLLT
ncbi:glycerophosphodiester phosphodiesterase [Leptospira fletcheri]|uniref:Glycerophosphodiester phosphodiesterase n=1 Tax=Leptospira fletcheri TaxID=2484981 RepID=A0A4R9GFS5_9LEPT|nr:glycerophosphodiester phosphodiesterase family protein [Leptospira fletcheri]TGK11437.1 glycerophosphodiester phosphodiesterase [Leptospira fletcheri]